MGCPCLRHLCVEEMPLCRLSSVTYSPAQSLPALPLPTPPRPLPSTPGYPHNEQVPPPLQAPSPPPSPSPPPPFPPLQAIPIMNEALAALDTIKEADITDIKKLGNPPAAIKLVLEAVCVILDAKPAKVGVKDGVWRP